MYHFPFDKGLWYIQGQRGERGPVDCGQINLGYRDSSDILHEQKIAASLGIDSPRLAEAIMRIK